jgi:bacterioferritin-associated ferredoxin
MYVCLCIGVTDRDIKTVLKEGACTVSEVMRCSGAGTRCGSCVPAIAGIVSASSGEAPASRRALQMAPPASNAA